MTIIVHDVSPCFRAEVETILQALSFLPVSGISAAAVPNWHHQDAPWTEDFTALVKNSFGEILLHGYAHTQRRRTFLSPLFTEWELAGENTEGVRDILSKGTEWMEEVLQTTPRGFVPPAWTGGNKLSPELLRGSGLSYSLNYFSLRSVHAAPTTLSTWSWDWGNIPGAGYAGHLAGNALSVRSQTVPQVVLHPADVKRGYLKQAVRRIEKLRSQGYEPVLPHTLAHA